MDIPEDYCVITKEDLEGIKDVISALDLPSAVDTIKDFLKQQDLVELNIGVTGETGSGKSTFVNAFRGLEDGDEGSAKTDIVETTTEPEAYLHPRYKNVKIWDLPGIGSPKFKADEYLELVQFERYDFFIIIASERFRECHTQLAKEIMKMGKRFYFVRSKIDLSVQADEKKKKENFDLQKTLKIIREDCEKGLREIIKDPVVFLISGWEFEKYDLNALQDRMEEELPQHKRQVLMLALPNITLEINEKKKMVLQQNIKYVAFLSACVAAVPIPGLSFAVDLAIIKVEIEKYCNAFGLSKESLKKLCDRYGKNLQTVESHIKSVWYKGVSTASIKSIMSSLSFLMTEDAVESVVRFLPLLGSVAAGAMSFWAVSTTLKNALNEIAEDARNVLIKLLETEV